jgi:basic amino acid/polyamine antiporter, APA family
MQLESVSLPPTVPFWKVMVLGVCALQIGPNLALAAGYQLQYSGLTSWLALSGAALVSMAVAVTLSRFARRYSITASLLSFARLSLPPLPVAVTAAAFLLGYVIGPAVGVLTTTIYFSSILSALGVPAADAAMAQCVIVIVASIFIGACAYRGVDLSARVAMILGVACIPIAIWLTLVAGHTVAFDIRPEFDLHAETPISLARGIFVGMAFYIGFDGVGALASETRDPHRSVPRVLQWTVGISGLALAFGALLQTPVLLLHEAALAAGDSPTRILANAGGIPSVALLSDIVLAMAGIAGLIAWLNCAAIIIATAAGEGFLPRALGKLHPTYGSPHQAVVFLSVVSIVLPVSLILWTRASPIQASLYLTNIDVLLWLVPYAILCVGSWQLRDAEKTDGWYRATAMTGLVAIIAIVAAQIIWPLDHVSAVINAVGASLIVAGSVVFFVLGPSGSGEPAAPLTTKSSV